MDSNQQHPTPPCPHPQDVVWDQQVPVCDTVQCGETAVFSVRDGGACAGAPGTVTATDDTGAYTFSCATSNATNSPCKACTNVAATDDCRWTWTAPRNTAEAALITTPGANKCRCTKYKPGSIRDWLCSDLSACATSSGRRLLGYNDGGKCPADYAGTRGCWLRDNWANVMRTQGRDGANALVLGAGDRTITMTLPALECACTAWGLGTKTLVSKPPP